MFFNPINSILLCIGVSVFSCAVFGYFFQRTWRHRLRLLEQDAERCSDTLCQMAETQMAIYQKVTRNIGSMEERILDLAAPGRDPSAPLERRHHVLTLARRGATLDEIVQRLNIPKGEAELLLKFSRYQNPKSARALSINEGVEHHA